MRIFTIKITSFQWDIQYKGNWIKRLKKGYHKLNCMYRTYKSMVNENDFTNYTCSIDKDEFDKPTVSMTFLNKSKSLFYSRWLHLVLYTSWRCTWYFDSKEHANSCMVRSIKKIKRASKKGIQKYSIWARILWIIVCYHQKDDTRTSWS